MKIIVDVSPPAEYGSENDTESRVRANLRQKKTELSDNHLPGENPRIIDGQFACCCTIMTQIDAFIEINEATECRS